jgi:hypothetical protein
MLVANPLCWFCRGAAHLINVLYQVRYWHDDFPEFVMWRDLYGQHDSAIIIGLQDNTNYWASVQVMNYAGVGPIGEIRLAETLHLGTV